MQRGRDITIDGYALPFCEVKVYFDNRMYVSDSDDKGYFDIKLPAMEAGGPYTLKISDKNDIVSFDDIYVGDVFLLSGQSNMELPVVMTLDETEEDIKDIDFPLIRTFHMPKEFRFDGPDKICSVGEWVKADSETVLGFSAIGFFFARKKFEKDGIPVGLIDATMGGTRIESFMSEKRVLKTGEKLRRIAKEEGRPLKCECEENDACKMCYEEVIRRNKDDLYVRDIIKSDLERVENWNKKTDADDRGLLEKWFDHEWSQEEKMEGVDINVPDSWLDTVLKNRIGTVWLQKNFDLPESFTEGEALLRMGCIVDADVIYVNGVEVGRTDFFYPPRRYKVPEGILKSGKNVITIRVIINNNVGEFKKDMPYYLRNSAGDKISLEGVWCARVAAVENPQGGMTFFTWHPTALFNKQIYPLRNTEFKACLFYQGESNTRYPEDYEHILVDMINEFRHLFGEDLPFLVAKLPYFRGESWEMPSDGWENLRDAQARAIDRLDNAEAVDLYDLGVYNDIHPQNKKEVAERFYDEFRRLVRN